MIIWKITFLIFITIIVLLTIFPSYTHAETVRFDVTGDVWISAYPGEENLNMGAASRLKLKGIQEMAILDFDLSSLKGKRIENARLYLRNTNNNNKLRKIGISTVASPWIEGLSRGYFVDVIGKGATFFHSSYKRQKWAGQGSDLTDVTMGNGNTWQHHTGLKMEDGKWWSIDVAPPLIQALLSKKSYGLLIMDESGQTFTNNYLYSSESKRFSPYMVVTYSEVKKERPQMLEVMLIPSFENAHIKSGAVVLKIPIKEKLLAFDIYVNDEEVPLWRVPKPGPVDSMQEIVLDWLPPGERVNVKVMAVDELGQRSEPVFITGYASMALPRITPVYKSDNDLKQRELTYENSEPLSVWAVPEVTKIDPVSGDVLSEVEGVEFDRRNSIWSADKREITLLGVKGEVIGFQLVVEADDRSLNSLKIEMSPLVGNAGDKIPAERFSLYQVHYLKMKQNWYPELAVPMNDGEMILEDERPIGKDQKDQSIYIDLSIPSGIEAGFYRGTISILWNGDIKKSLRVSLRVADILMPEKLTFVPELNMYKGPGRAGTERFLDAHRIAHEHRTVINRVPYGQDGTIHKDMIPDISYSEDGRINVDWSNYDSRLGPLFDGTAFMEDKRKGIPVEKFYLPFFENWPANLASNYQYENAAKKTRYTISRHALEAPPLYKALTSQYKERFIGVLKEFKKHFEEKGWEQTEFQFYLNNKWHWKGASSWWNLDEPMSYDDWMALRFFGSLFHKAVGVTPIRFVFRADISRPRWQRDWLNGVLQRMYVSTKAFFRYSDRVRRLKEEGQINFSVYGSLNEIESSNHETILWCMRAFVEGADGVLPWQSLGGSKSFTLPDRNALIVDSREILEDIDWVVSLRVKALRRCQQNVELLAMLEEKYGYNREQIRTLFYDYFKRAFLKEGAEIRISTQTMEDFRKMLIEILLE
ncbi:MAG: hypothetical protein ACE5IH_02485 [Thermodesulfobacteriota bacterium]